MVLVSVEARLAAANNAAWCDIVCRTHAVAGSFDQDAWTSRTRMPPFYPDAVTLVPEVSAPDLLARIDNSPGCSIKDSFASLDLTPFGFVVLFDAQWIVRRTAAVRPSSADLLWGVVSDPESFVLWEQAWRGQDGPADVLRCDLVHQDAVTVLAGRDGGEIVAGAVLSRSLEVIGITNFFSNIGSAAANWAGCLGYIDVVRPGAVLVAYDVAQAPAPEGVRLDAFEPAGALRVWQRER